jgi:biopolymer transport protein ExbD
MALRRRVSTEFSSASMSDIAFLLLIFFLVTTIFAVEKGIPMILPGDAPAKKVKNENVMTIRAHAGGAVTADDKRVQLVDLREIVKKRLEANEKLIVVVENHPDSEYGLMVDILDELRLVGARRISLKEMRL